MTAPTRGTGPKGCPGARGCVDQRPRREARPAPTHPHPNSPPSLASRARAWLTAHPTALDAALAVGVLLAMVAGAFVDPHAQHGDKWGARTPDVLSIVLMVPAAAVLIARRRAPWPCWPRPPPSPSPNW